MPTVRASLGTSATDLVTVTTGKVARFTLIQVANVDETSAADVTVHWTDSSSSNAVTRLVHTAEVAVNDALSAQGQGLTLDAGDKLWAQSSATASLEITVCYYEEDA